MEKLKVLRLEANKRQIDVAGYLGISPQAYAHYEKDRRQPDPKTLKKLAEYFNVSVDCLLEKQSLQENKQPLSLEKFATALNEKGLSKKDIENLSRDQWSAIAEIIRRFI